MPPLDPLLQDCIGPDQVFFAASGCAKYRCLNPNTITQIHPSRGFFWITCIRNRLSDILYCVPDPNVEGQFGQIFFVICCLDLMVKKFKFGAPKVYCFYVIFDLLLLVR